MGYGRAGRGRLQDAASRSRALRLSRRIIWDRTRGNPIPHVSQELGIDPYVCSDALHTIKQSAGLRPNDDVVIYDNGDVTVKLNGDEIGNLYDEH